MGVRGQVGRHAHPGQRGPAVRVHSRHGHDHTAAFPSWPPSGPWPPFQVVLDGELVCLDAATGRPSFERLMARTQARLPAFSARQDPATFMAFDVLAVDGGDLCARPWAERRQLLQDLHDLAANEPSGGSVLPSPTGLVAAATAGMGLEGVVAKRVTSRYWPGRRTPYWRKVKHRSYEWFDLLGWRAPKGRDPGGLLAGRDGRVIACAFPALPSGKAALAALLAEHGVEVPGGVQLPAGRAEVEVGYLERLPAGDCGNRWPAPSGLSEAKTAVHGRGARIRRCPPWDSPWHRGLRRGRMATLHSSGFQHPIPVVTRSRLFFLFAEKVHSSSDSLGNDQGGPSS